MAKRKIKPNLNLIITCALLIGLSIVLSKLVSINLPIIRIGLGFLPIAILGIYYGPLIAGFSALIADVLGALIFPTGAYFPGFTLTAFLTGFVFGLFLKGNKAKKISRIIISSSIVAIFLNLLLNSYWLSIIIGRGFSVLIKARAIKEILSIPVMVVLIKACDRFILSHITNQPRS